MTPLATKSEERTAAREAAFRRIWRLVLIPPMALPLWCFSASVVQAQASGHARSTSAGRVEQRAARLMPQVRRAHYRQPPPPIPPGFTYNGRPMEAACLESFVDGEGAHPRPVLLKNCPRPPTVLDCEMSRNHDDDPWWDLRGFRGYCFGAAGNRQINIAYKYLGKWRGHNALLVESSYGMSSSSVERHVLLADVRGKPPALVLARMFATAPLVPIDARVAGGRLLFTASVQGAQFAALSGLELPTELSPLDFPDSGVLADTDVAEFENGKLKTVSLLPYLGKRPQARSTAAGLHAGRQKCFEQVHREYLSVGRTELAPAAVRVFAQKVFNCMEAVR